MKKSFEEEVIRHKEDNQKIIEVHEQDKAEYAKICNLFVTTYDILKASLKLDHGSFFT